MEQIESSPSMSWDERSRRLLAAAGVALASSLDYELTIQTLANLAVEHMAEWCSVDVLSTTGELDKLAVAHRDAERIEWARRFQEKYPTDVTAQAGLAQVLRSGKPLLVPTVTKEMLAGFARNAEHLADLMKIGVGSVILAPLVARGKVLGALTLLHPEPGRYHERDVELAVDLGRLAALALENSHLYTEAQKEISERRRAEAALRESESRFRELADAMPVMVWTTDPKTGDIFTNRYYREYTGPVEGKGAQGWANVVHPEDRPRAFATYRKSYEAGTPWEEELRLRRHDGAYRWHLSRSVPAFDEADKAVLWYGTSTDIHERRAYAEELERRVRERTAELTQSNQEMEAFTYSVAHDLRAPLRAIVATSKIVLSEAEDLPEEFRNMLSRQEANARRLGELIDALLGLARVSRREPEREKVDVTALVTGVVAEMELSAACAVSVERGMTAIGDAPLLRVAFQNLLDNARKYSPGGCDILVGTTEIDDQKAFFVRDRGIGFEMQYVEKVFQPFERLVREEQFSGTGIGLATVERIVRRHGGRVWAESEPGKGATFFFTLRA